jgi:Uma2 family endonuclease
MPYGREALNRPETFLLHELGERHACAKLVSDFAGTLWWIVEKGELTGGYTIHTIATHAAIRLSEYLGTSYRPDRDYVDGELQQRNLGEREHALLQLILGSIFRNNRHVWDITAMTELRSQVSPTRFRVPDICVLRADAPREQVVTHPPLLVIEILSKHDTLRAMRERVDDYVVFGIQHIWLVDPGQRRAYLCGPHGFEEPDIPELNLADTPIHIELASVCAELDEQL